MFKELLNKIKKAGSLCAAIAKSEMYTPYVREAIKRYEEAQQQAKYAKGGVIGACAQRYVLDDDEKIFCLEAWKKNNEALNAGLESLAQAIKQCAVSWQDLADGMRELARQAAQKEEEKIKRQNANNWRKMHGLPMRRKAGRKK